MPTFDTWPFDRLSPADLEWSPTGGVDTGGASLSGLEQLDRTDGGPKWIANMVRIPLGTREQILAFQALQMTLEEGAGLIVLPRRPRDRAPIGAASSGALTPHSDGTPHSDETLYLTPTTVASTVGAYELRDDEITFTFAPDVVLLAGMEFSIVHPNVGKRMYRIKRILSRDGAEYVARIGPGFREDVTDGTPMNFDDPGCVMRLSDPKAFRAALSFNRYGYTDAAFEEAFF